MKKQSNTSEAATTEVPISQLFVFDDGVVVAMPVATFSLDVTHPILGNVVQQNDVFNLPLGSYQQERRDYGMAWIPTGLTTRSSGPKTEANQWNWQQSINLGGNTDLRLVRTGN